MKQLFLIPLFMFALSLSGLQAQTFETDFGKAKLRSQAENKPMLLIFSGSDWCKPCILLKKEILTSSEFRAYAEDHLVVVNLDFPLRKKNQLSVELKEQNEALAEQYNSGGAFPLVLLLKEDLSVEQQLQYKPNMKPVSFVAQLEPILPQ